MHVSITAVNSSVRNLVVRTLGKSHRPTLIFTEKKSSSSKNSKSFNVGPKHILLWHLISNKQSLIVHNKWLANKCKKNDKINEM